MMWVLLGPPGAGKGTQAVRLATDLGWLHLSTGDLFRAHLAADTPLGREAAEYMRSGGLVPDDTVIAMVADRLAQPDARAGVLLDGFPRTVAQAEALDRLARATDEPLPRALAILVARATVLERMTGRRVCRAAGHPYHVVFQPPRTPDVCDLDGSALYRREDDAPETVARRMDVYEAETAPVLAYYEAAGRLVAVPGEDQADAVFARLRAAVPAPG
jgi:adenylate kinase